MNSAFQCSTMAAGCALILSVTVVTSSASHAAESESRRIEEVIVTAERKEATISDTSISISAFDEKFLQDFNIRNQEDLQNYIPATTIQPYDASIRGIGRTARTLGGDPGVATYFNDVYSEDFGIASTEGGLHDLERVEVLRGPQGTLYGRNAVGGAINFVSKRPSTSEYEAEVKLTAGNYDTKEIYYMLSGPLIRDTLALRFTGSDRSRDGYIEETSGQGPDINNYGDENYTLSFLFTPTDRISLYARANERSYRRLFNGGAGTMPIVVNAGREESVRNNSQLFFGQRIIDRGQTAVPFQSDYFDSSMDVHSYTHPITGQTVETQNVRPGIDVGSALSAPSFDAVTGAPIIDPITGLQAYGKGDTVSSSLHPNFQFGYSPDQLHIADRDSLDKGDLKISSNGQYDEFFDHQAVQMNLAYDADNWRIKYVFGYTDFFYDRNTDEDKTGSRTLGSSDFYVLQENHNWQHEIQLNFDTERLSVTAGAFVYESNINQRLDLYDPIDTQGRFQEDANYSGVGGPAVFGGTLEVLGALGILGNTQAQTSAIPSIRSAERATQDGTLLPDPVSGTSTLLSPWYGEISEQTLRGARHDGTRTSGTFFQWDNDLNTRAYAAYTQAEYSFTEKWSVTAGIRYAKDEKKGAERAIGQTESVGLTGLALFDLVGNPGPGTAQYFADDPAGAAACGFGVNILCLYNAVSGAIDPVASTAAGDVVPGDQGTNPGDEPIRFAAVPIAFNVYRPFDDDWDVWTWRLNLDYQPNPDTLLYLSATTGWRSGGYNLGFFSGGTSEYEAEDIIAYELGYKGTLLDGTLQLNTSIYFYQYDDIQTILVQTGGLFGTSTNVVNFPEAQTFGWEGDIMYLIGDRFTLGGNWSYTNAEFTSDFDVVDVNNPEKPGTIFSSAERSVSGFDGASLPKIPEWKFTLWGNYTWPLGEAGTLDFFTTVGYTDDFFFNAPFERDLDRAPSFTRWDARMSWRSPGERWEVSAFVNNITGEIGVRALEGVGEQYNFQRRVTTTDPRVYGVSLLFHWAQ